MCKFSCYLVVCWFCMQLVQTKEVLRWIYDHRLAHFCRSHLYFDYQVMKEMGTDMECIEDTLRFKRYIYGCTVCYMRLLTYVDCYI